MSIKTCKWLHDETKNHMHHISSLSSHPALMRCVPVESLSGTPQDTLAFTLRLSKWFERSDHNESWWLCTLGFTAVSSQLDHPRWMLMPAVSRVIVFVVSVNIRLCCSLFPDVLFFGLDFLTVHSAQSFLQDGAHHPGFLTDISIPFALVQLSITWLSCVLPVKGPRDRDLWLPDPPPLDSPIRVFFPGVCCSIQMIKLTDWRS